MDSGRAYFKIPTISREPTLTTREFCTAKGKTEKIPDENMEAPLSETFFTRKMKILLTRRHHVVWLIGS